MVELRAVKQQRRGAFFIDVLNKVRVDNLGEILESTLILNFFSPAVTSQSDLLHTCAVMFLSFRFI